MNKIELGKKLVDRLGDNNGEGEPFITLHLRYKKVGVSNERVELKLEILN